MTSTTSSQVTTNSRINELHRLVKELYDRMTRAQQARIEEERKAALPATPPVGIASRIDCWADATDDEEEKELPAVGGFPIVPVALESFRIDNDMGATECEVFDITSAGFVRTEGEPNEEAEYESFDITSAGFVTCEGDPIEETGSESFDITSAGFVSCEDESRKAAECECFDITWAGFPTCEDETRQPVVRLWHPHSQNRHVGVPKGR